MATADGRNLNPVLRSVEKLSLETNQVLQQRLRDEMDSDVDDQIDSQEGKSPFAST